MAGGKGKTRDGENKETVEETKVSEADKAAAEKAEADKAAAEKAEEAEVDYPTVAEGKALTTKRGILADGDKIEAKDLQGGKETFDKFVKTGHIVLPK